MQSDMRNVKPVYWLALLAVFLMGAAMDGITGFSRQLLRQSSASGWLRLLGITNAYSLTNSYMLASANLTNWSLYSTNVVNQRQWGSANLTNWSLYPTSIIQTIVASSNALKIDVNNGVFTNLTGSRLTISSNVVYSEGFWQDTLCPLIAGGVPAVSAADLEILIGGIEAYRFDSGQSNCVFVTVQLPHGIKRVTNNVHPHLHWTSATPATNVIWGLQYVQANISGILTNSSATVFFTNTCDTAFKHCVNSWPFINVVGSTNVDSQIMHCKVFRPNDGIAQDVFGLSFDPHCLIESPGSIPESPP